MEFIISLVALLRKVERALVILEDLSGSGQKHAELITGSFDGIKVKNPFHLPSHFSVKIAPFLFKRRDI